MERSERTKVRASPAKESPNKILFMLRIVLFLSIFASKKIIAMTAIELQTDTMQLLQQFDKTNVSLWKRILDAVAAIYQDEETLQEKKRAEQKSKIREMIGVFEKSDSDDWKQVKEGYLTEKYANQEP